MTEKTHLYVSLSPRALEFLNTELSSGSGQANFPFPDYVISLLLDRSIPGQGCRLDHLGSRDETRTKMAHDFPSGILPENTTRLVDKGCPSTYLS